MSSAVVIPAATRPRPDFKPKPAKAVPAKAASAPRAKRQFDHAAVPAKPAALAQPGPTPAIDFAKRHAAAQAAAQAAAPMAPAAPAAHAIPALRNRPHVVPKPFHGKK